MDVGEGREQDAEALREKMFLISHFMDSLVFLIGNQITIFSFRMGIDIYQ